MSEDRRKTPRMAMTLPVRVRCSGRPEIEVTTGDLSQGGAFLNGAPADFPPIGTEVQVQAVKPPGDGDPAPVIRARIVRSTPGGVGIEFLIDPP